MNIFTCSQHLISYSSLHVCITLKLHDPQICLDKDSLKFKLAKNTEL